MGIPDLASSPLSLWEVPPAPADSILSLNQAYLNDPHPNATNLSIGAYRDHKGQPHEFRVVRKANRFFAALPFDHAYLPIIGYMPLIRHATVLLHREKAVREGRVAAVHTVSGSCALRLALTFCKQVLACGEVWISWPSWPNHEHIANAVDLKVHWYAYYNFKTMCLNVEGMLQDLRRGKKGAVVILQPCGHNPTGMDLTEGEWRRVASVVKEMGMITVFDMAYLGLVSGDVETDLFAVRLFTDMGINVIVALSFSKSLGLYNSRVGVLSVCLVGEFGVAETAKNVTAQLGWLSRAMYSSPPVEGAKITAWVLEKVKREWEREMGEMVTRMRAMRVRLVEELRALHGGRNWDHVLTTRGMFVLLGLTEKEVERLRRVHHVYVTADSRMNVAGISEDNVGRVARAISEVVAHTQLGKENTI